MRFAALELREAAVRFSDWAGKKVLLHVVGDRHLARRRGRRFATGF